jgi:hypothetical protein
MRRSQNAKLVKGDDTVVISVGFLEESSNLSVGHNTIAIGVGCSKHGSKRPKTTQNLAELFDVDGTIVVQVKLVELCLECRGLLCSEFGHLKGMSVQVQEEQVCDLEAGQFHRL